MRYKNWDIVRLGDICQTTSGGTPSKAHSEYYQGGQIPWLRSGDFCPEIFKTECFITEDGMKNSSAKMVPANSVVVAMYGATVGECGILRIPTTTNQAVCSILPSDKITPEFLYYFLRNNKKEYLKLAVGGAQPNISQQIIKETKLCLPPIDVQKNIVEELNLLTSILAKKKEQISGLEILAHATFYEMFGDPVTNDKGWNTAKLADVAPAEAYKGEVSNQDGKYWLLNLDMVESNSGNIIEKLIVDEDEIGNSTNKFSCKNVLYSKLRPYLNKVVIPDDCGYCTTELVPLCPNESLTRYYLAFLLRSASFVQQISIKVAGAKMPRVTMSDLWSFDCPIPPIKLQQEFEEKVKGIERQKELIQDSIEQTQTLLDATIEKYFG